MLTDEEKIMCMQVVYACASVGILREAVEMIEKSLNYETNGRTKEADYAKFVSDELQKMAVYYNEKVIIQ